MDVFGSNGVRGVVGERMTPAFVTRVARAAGTYFDADRVALARDTRTSGRMLADAAAAGLASTGTTVERLGVVPTPAAQHYSETEGMPAIVVTASHNPAEYNGVKLYGADGVGLAVTDLEAVESVLADGAARSADWRGVGDQRRAADAAERYVSAVVDAAPTDLDLTVALDPGHGAGTVTSPDVFRRLGCSVVTVHGQPDGCFPGRPPEPVPSNLGDLCRLVRTSDADVGVAHDGDADRAMFVDETGSVVPGDAVLAALAADSLDAGDTAVGAVNVSQRLVDAVEAADASLELTPIGSTHITTRIRELQDAGESVPVAGEGNGGIVFPGYRLARDGAYTATRVLALAAARPLSEVVAPFDDYHDVRENVPYGDVSEREAMVGAAAAYAEESDADLSTVDGYRLDYGDAWVLARPSGTEPVVRVYAEATDAERARSLAGEMANRLRAAI